LQLRWFSARILRAYYAVNRSFGVVNDIDRLPFREQQVSKHFHQCGGDKLPEVFENRRYGKTHHRRRSPNQSHQFGIWVFLYRKIDFIFQSGLL
jgi:hypothetical protein